jgi:hypothetical protein
MFDFVTTFFLLISTIFRLYEENCIQNVLSLPSSNNPLSIITNYNWQVAALTQCHEVSGCLVLGTPLLSSWWIATSIWSKAAFDTWIGAPPSLIGMLSISKAQLPNNRCRRPLLLSITKVRSLLGLEASRALIYNGYIQRQTHWYLQITPPHVMNMM